MWAVATGPWGAGGRLLPGVAVARLPQPRAHRQAPVILEKDTTAKLSHWSCIQSLMIIHTGIEEMNKKTETIIREMLDPKLDDLDEIKSDGFGWCLKNINWHTHWRNDDGPNWNTTRREYERDRDGFWRRSKRIHGQGFRGDVAGRGRKFTEFFYNIMMCKWWYLITNQKNKYKCYRTRLCLYP